MVQVYEEEAMGYAPVLKSKLIFKGIVAKEHVFSCRFWQGKDILQSRFGADKNYSLTTLSIVGSYYATKGGSIFYLEI